MDTYDAYIVHAGEDREIAAALTTALEERGLNIWFNSFRVGISIRRQMENGLASSSVGIVIVTPNLFAKKWAREELDGLYALETDGDDPKIFPVWVGITAEAVQKFSPMMAMRHAIVSQSADEVDAEAIAQLADAIISRTGAKSPAQYLRAEIKNGLPWRMGPGFLIKSLQLYDEQFDDFSMLSMAHHPDGPPDGLVGQPAPLLEFLRAPMAYDGTIISAIARQVEGTQQILDIHDDVQLGSYNDQPVPLAGHVFQLRSVEFSEFHICYVHCFGPYHPDLSPYVPFDRLCWVTGLILAHGVVETAQGNMANAIYIAARALYSMPPILDADPSS